MAGSRGAQGTDPVHRAGDPAPQLTVPLLHALACAGADVIELGVPFSDPMADGPVIQRATERAIRQGVGLRRTLEIGGRVPPRRRDDAGGADGLCQSDRAHGTGRVRRRGAARQAWTACWWSTIRPRNAPSLPLRLRAHGIDPIFLLAPTSTDGADRAGRRARRGLRLLRQPQGDHRRGASRHRERRGRLPLIRALHAGAGRRRLRHPRCGERGRRWRVCRCRRDRLRG